METTGYVPYDPGMLHLLPSGTVLHQRYQLQRVLGQGGFGITYLATDYQRQMAVAVKEFYPRTVVTRDCSWSLEVKCITQQMLPSFRGSKERFLREASALRRLRDVRSIVEILDYFEENGTAYIVMEYVSGVDLKTLMLRRGKCLTVEETLRLLEPVFQALITVHRAGLIHRDISPDNIMLDPREGAKLLDFGAVRSVEAPDVNAPLTSSTVAILKHGFAPIEQYNTRGSLGPWTDEYALCATIWYCLTGQVPEQVTVRLSERIEPDWSRIPGLDPNRRRALEKGMAIYPQDRFPDVEQLYQALYLGWTMADPTPDPHPVPAPDKKPLKKLLIGLTAAVLAIAVGLGAWKLVEALGDDGPSTSLRGADAEEDDGPAISEPETQPSEAPAQPPSETPEQDPTEAPTEAPSQDWIHNVLTKDPLNVMLGASWDDEELALKSRQKIRSVTFLDDTSGSPDIVYHLGAGGTDAVLGWLEWSGGYIDVYIAADGGMDASNSCRQLFYGCVNLQSIDFGSAFHTDGCEDMYRMFYGCHELRSLDVSSFDTSSVITMQAMFRDCKNLTELDVTAFDTSRVENMAQMFSTCTSIEYFDLRTFDTSRVTNMSYMFSACHSLWDLNVSSFDTSRVTNMEGVFNYCGELDDLKLSWDVSNVSNHAGFMLDGKTINGRPWQEYFR